MNKEYVNKTFKDLKLKFKRYYGYYLYFEGESYGYIIKTIFGGDADDIYYFDADVDLEYEFGNCDKWSSVKILDKETKEIIFECFNI